MKQNEKLLVTGGSGNLGKWVLTHLLESFKVDPANLITTTRNVESLKEFADKGVDVREADFENPDSLVEAFTGADRLLLISTSQIGKRAEMHTNAVKAAEKAGVSHLVYTSMPNPNISPVIFAPEHVASETVVMNSEIPSFTILRNNWYYDNLLSSYAHITQSGTWLTTNKSAYFAQLSREDLAYAAAAALTNNTNSVSIVTLNGSEILTVADMAETITSVTGRKINVIEVDDDQYKAEMEKAGVPADYIGFFLSFEQHNSLGASIGDSTEYELLTGKKPESFKSWVEKNKETFVSL